MLNPTNTRINVVRALDAKIDAWRGGALLADKYFKSDSIKDFTISKKEYEECGHHYLKEHVCSNYLYGQRPSTVKSPKTKFTSDAYKRSKA